MQPGILPLRHGDEPSRRDIFDFDIAIADPTERLVKGMHEAAIDLEHAQQRRTDWELERELRLLRMAASAQGDARTREPKRTVDDLMLARARDMQLVNSGMAPQSGKVGAAGKLRGVHSRDVHLRETALSQLGRSAVIAALGPGQAGMADFLAGVRNSSAHTLLLEDARRAADASRGFGGAQVRQGAQQAQQQQQARWSDSLYTEHRPSQVWSRPDVSARFCANYDAQLAAAHAIRASSAQAGGSSTVAAEGGSAPPAVAVALHGSDSDAGDRAGAAKPAAKHKPATAGRRALSAARRPVASRGCGCRGGGSSASEASSSCTASSSASTRACGTGSDGSGSQLTASASSAASSSWAAQGCGTAGCHNAAGSRPSRGHVLRDGSARDAERRLPADDHVPRGSTAVSRARR